MFEHNGFKAEFGKPREKNFSLDMSLTFRSLVPFFLDRII